MSYKKGLMQCISKKLADCAAACEKCMDSCLFEDDLNMMVKCIRLDRDCAKICQLTASFIASDSQHAQHVIIACIVIWEQCAVECGNHDDEHCQKCAQKCEECAEACRNYSKANP